MTRTLRCLLPGVIVACAGAVCAELPQNQTRTGITQKFGSGTLTRRSDGTSSQSRPFGSGSITTERGPDGKTIQGITTPFGSGSVTRWSDGSRSTTRPFGSGSMTINRTGPERR